MRVQRVVSPDDGAESWTVLAGDWAPVEPVELFLAHLSDQGRSPNTVKAYAHDLKDYFECLEARIAEIRDNRANAGNAEHRDAGLTTALTCAPQPRASAKRRCNAPVMPCQLETDGGPVPFDLVARTGVSRAWLYNEPAIRDAV